MTTRKPVYEIPQVISYTDDDIIEELGEVYGMPPPVSPSR